MVSDVRKRTRLRIVRERARVWIERRREHPQAVGVGINEIAVDIMDGFLVLLDGADGERVEEAFDEIGVGGVYDLFDASDPADAIRQLGQYLREAAEALPGGFMPGEDSPYYGMSLADRIRELRGPEAEVVTARVRADDGSDLCPRCGRGSLFRCAVVGSREKREGAVANVRHRLAALRCENEEMRALLEARAARNPPRIEFGDGRVLTLRFPPRRPGGSEPEGGRTRLPRRPYYGKREEEG